MTNDDGKAHWFVAYVRSCCEKKCAQMLAEYGYECYLPVQKEWRQWSDRRKLVDKPLLPRMIFVHCTRPERVKSMELVPYLSGYITLDGPYTPAIVRDDDMERFRRFVECSGRSVTITRETLAPGDRVRVMDGPLEGIECELVSVSGTRCLATKVGLLGNAYVELTRESLKKI